jgi:hypothetical protein
MRLFQIRHLLGALTALVSLTAYASTGDTYRFEVLLDEKPIGEHRFEVETDGAELRVNSEAEFKVDFLVFTAYRYRHQSNELFRDGCLQQIRATTNDNGTRYRVEGEATDRAFVIDRGEKVEQAPACIKTFAYWDPAILEQDRLLNPQTGELEAVGVRKAGVDRVNVSGREIDATRYALETDELTIELWYSETLGWVKLASDTGKGARLIYRRI